MSNFTNSTGFTPVSKTNHWQVTDTFNWYLKENSNVVVQVPEGFVFNGADIPFPFSILWPRVHTNYIQSACLHDYMLENLRDIFSREHIDLIFYQSLKALKNPPVRSWCMYQAVRIFGLLNERQKYFDIY